jgi:hypothetical protein
MYLVEFSRVGKLIIEDDGIYAIPEFLDILSKKGMGEPVLRYVALTVDYLSPYRHRPEEDRSEFVLRDVYGKDAKRRVDIENPMVVAAVAKYKILQYDSYREELFATRTIIQKTIKLKNDLEVNEENLPKIGSLISRVEKFEGRYETLKKHISEEGSDGPVKKKIPLFRLEKAYQLSQEIRN